MDQVDIRPGMRHCGCVLRPVTEGHWRGWLECGECLSLFPNQTCFRSGDGCDEVARWAIITERKGTKPETVYACETHGPPSN